MLRDDVLQLLKTASAGVSVKEISEQSNHVAFHEGYLLANSGEIIIRVKSPFPKEWSFTVEYAPFSALVSKMPDNEVQLEFQDNTLSILGKNRKASLATHQIAMTTHFEVPEKSEWRPVPDSLMDALTLVEGCCSGSGDSAVTTCLHFTQKHIEGTDKLQAARYKCKLEIDKPFCVEREAIRKVIHLPFKSYHISDKFLTFKGSGFIVFIAASSVEEYIDLDRIFVIEGEEIVFPKTIADAALTAEILSSSDSERNFVTVSIDEKKMTLTGMGDAGRYFAKFKLKKKSGQHKFQIAPKILVSLVQKSQTIHVAPDRLIVGDKSWVYATSIEAPQEDA